MINEVLLRDVREDDLPIFFEQQCDPEAYQMAAVLPRDREAFWAHWAKIMSDESVTIRTILLGDQVAGSLVSWERNGKRLVGYWIVKNYWGQGVATQALRQFVEVVRVRPLYAYVAKHNIGSFRVLQKCGFTICDPETEGLEPTGDGVEEVILVLTATSSSIGS